MGTRNLTMVILNNEIKVAQYGQWDGYPSGQGRRIIKFISRMNKKKFVERLKNVKFISVEEIENRMRACGWKETGRGTFSIEYGKDALWNTTYPELSRDIGAKILKRIYNGKAKELKDSSAFASDGLYCEWGYVLDLDNDILEIYVGSDEPTPKGQRFSDFPVLKYNIDCNYYPIQLVQKIKFEDCKFLKFKFERVKARKKKFNRM